MKLLSSSAAKFTLLILLFSKRVNRNAGVKAVLSLVSGLFIVGLMVSKYHQKKGIKYYTKEGSEMFKEIVKNGTLSKMVSD